MKNRQRIIFLYPSGFLWRSLAKPLQSAFIQPSIHSCPLFGISAFRFQSQGIVSRLELKNLFKNKTFILKLNDNIFPAEE